MPVKDMIIDLHQLVAGGVFHCSAFGRGGGLVASCYKCKEILFWKMRLGEWLFLNTISFFFLDKKEEACLKKKGSKIL